MALLRYSGVNPTLGSSPALADDAGPLNKKVEGRFRDRRHPRHPRLALTF